MKITSFKLFENTTNVTNGNTFGMGNIGASQPSQDGSVNEYPSKRIPEPKEEPKPEPTNESIVSFNDFKINEDGGVAMATMGNTTGMGNVSSPGVSTDGSINTYSGNGNPTSSAKSGSGDRVASLGTAIQKQPKMKKARRRPPKCEKIIPFNNFFSTKVVNETANFELEEVWAELKRLDEKIDFIIENNKLDRYENFS